MVDLFPYPHVDDSMPVEMQTKQIVNYLARLKEELEFVISSINDKEVKLTDKQINQINQMINDGLNITEIVKSKEFKKEVESSVSIKMHLNIDTGCLEYY